MICTYDACVSVYVCPTHITNYPVVEKKDGEATDSGPCPSLTSGRFSGFKQAITFGSVG